jgi:hypothetical protein
VTPARIAELRALCEKATEGPWVDCDEDVKWDTVLMCGYDHRAAGSLPPYYATGPRVDTCKQAELDSRFIAASRTALPEALDEIERLKAKINKLANEGDHADWCEAGYDSDVTTCSCGYADVVSEADPC